MHCVARRALCIVSSVPLFQILVGVVASSTSKTGVLRIVAAAVEQASGFGSSEKQRKKKFGWKKCHRSPVRFRMSLHCAHTCRAFVLVKGRRKLMRCIGESMRILFPG